MRAWVAAGLVLAACSDAPYESRLIRPEADPPVAAPAGKAEVLKEGGVLSVLAGVDGTITTLAVYGDGSPHPGVNSIDVGAGGGTPVWYQVGALPDSVAGGWIHAYVVHEAGYCSQWTPGSPYYNGAKVYVETWFYGAGGEAIGWHRAAFQHVDPDGSTVDGWWKWNNAGAAAPLWGDARFVLGNGTAGGMPVGAVHGIAAPVYNGPGGGLCTDGSHLHQEGAGARDGSLWRGEGVAGRSTALHVFRPAGGMAPGGAPPDAPGATAADCGGLDYAGVCEGAVLRWCEGGALRVRDCAASGLACGWQDAQVGNNCVAPPLEAPPAGEPPAPPADETPAPDAPAETPAAPPAPPAEETPAAQPAPDAPAETPAAPPAPDCAGLDYAGSCDGGVLRWCEAGAPRSYDCAAAGKGCGWQDDQVGFNCVAGCGDLDYAGRCDGTTLRWCEGGAPRSYDCAKAGMGCGWQDGATGNNCLH
jgi:hypothetical protein